MDSRNRGDTCGKKSEAKYEHNPDGGGQAAYGDPHHKVEATDVPWTSCVRDPELKEWFDKKCKLEDWFTRRLDDFKEKDDLEDPRRLQ